MPRRTAVRNKAGHKCTLFIVNHERKRSLVACMWSHTDGPQRPIVLQGTAALTGAPEDTEPRSLSVSRSEH